jgi:hypothetical protein
MVWIKEGNGYLVNEVSNKADKRSLWIINKKENIGQNKIAVALANKNARIAWALLANEEVYRKSAIAV